MPSLSSIRRFAGAGLLCATVAAGAAQPDRPADAEAVRSIRIAIAAQRCQDAVATLKAGVKDKLPRVLFMAGVMHEEGICVAADWDKAAALYMMAYDAREPNAVHRLMAGYADRSSDAGMAFWWAARNPVRDRFPAQCIPKANADADPDGFNSELERMPPAVFAACSYLFAVVGTVSVQSEYPPLALYHGVSGSVAMEFDPASGRIAWRQQDVNMAERPARMVRDLAREELDDPRKIRDSLLSYMKARGDAALARHRKPLPALDPDYVYRTTFVFGLHAD